MFFHLAIAHGLANHGVDIVFGVLGDANLHMMHSFQVETAGRYIALCHEAAAVSAASGYARTSGHLGVATVTHGPGLTNTVTALVDCVKDRSPVLIVAGDTAVTEREHLQKIVQQDVVRSSGAAFEQVRSPQTVAEDLASAVRRALVERLPVVLNVPIEFQWTRVNYQMTDPRATPSQAINPDPVVLDAAVGIVASAKRPVVLAGRGALGHEARAALLSLADRIGAPVATTLRAKDFFRGERYNLGVCGTLSNDVALKILAESDCILAFGASLNKWTTADGSLFQKKRVVHVDVDLRSISRWTAATVGVIGDAAVVARTIVDWLDEAKIPPSGFASRDMAEQLRGIRVPEDEATDANGTVGIRTALKRIDDSFPYDRTVVLDVGRFFFDAVNLLHVPQADAYIHTANFGSVGLGMGNAIGASFGAPARPTLLVAGDGGFMLGGLAEFNSAVRHGADLVVVLLNDSAYGAEYVQLRNRDMDPTIATFEWPDFASVANALGGKGYVVRTLEELDAAMQAIKDRTGPILIDVRIDPEEVWMPNY